MKGNFVLNGVVVKKLVVVEEMLVYEGLVRVFNLEEEVVNVIFGKKINKGDVIVIRYEGLKGGLGMKEMLFFILVVVGMGFDKYVVFFIDGCFLGVIRGVFIGYIFLEVMEGGLIGLVEEGDIIFINILDKKLELKVDEVEIENRKLKFKFLELKIKYGYLSRYVKLVILVNIGVVLK